MSNTIGGWGCNSKELVFLRVEAAIGAEGCSEREQSRVVAKGKELEEGMTLRDVSTTSFPVSLVGVNLVYIEELLLFC